MIKFKKSSLIYKMNKVVGGWEFGANACSCKSLCSYFWSTVWNVVLLTFLVVGGYLITTFIGITLLEETGVNLVVPLLWYAWLVGVLTLPLFFLCGFLFIYSSVKLYEVSHGIGLTSKNNTVSKEPNLLIEWVKAKKSKICPMIVFVDKEEK